MENYYDNMDPIPIFEEDQVVDTEESIEETCYGVVVNCLKLAVRARPSKDGEMIRTLDALSEVEIDTTYNNENWYHIYTVDGLDGYCMKKYMALRQ